MVEILSNLIKDYIEPILKFTDVYIGEDGALRPVGVDNNDYVYKYEEKDVIVVRTDNEFEKIKNKKDEFEILNPFLIPKHMTFITYLLLNKINDIEKTPGSSSKDETTDEPKKLSIGTFQSKNPETGLPIMELCYVDNMGNPNGIITSYTSTNPFISLSMYGLCLNAYKTYKRVIPPQLMDTDLAIDAIVLGLSKYEKARKAKGKQLTGFQAIDMTDEDDDYIVIDYTDNEYEYDLKIDSEHCFKRFKNPFMSNAEQKNFTFADFDEFCQALGETPETNEEKKETDNKLNEIFFNSVKSHFDEVDIDID